MPNLENLSGADLQRTIAEMSKELGVGKPIIEEHPGHNVPTVPEGTSMTGEFKDWQRRCLDERNEA
ncbi:hypothetical protein ACFL3T_03675 [Patescibacteria group bacterium]